MTTCSPTPFVPLKYIAEIVSGGTPKSDPSNWDGDIPFITPPDLNGLDGDVVSQWERALTDTGTSGSSITKDAVLLSCRAPIGHVGVVTSEMAFNQGCKSIVPQDAEDLAYVAYCLVASRRALQALGRGTTFMEISTTQLSNFSIPWPVCMGRRAITRYLDRETSEIDAMLAKLASLSESVSERRREIVRSILKSVRQTVRLGLVVDVVSGSGFPDRFQGIPDEELPFYKVSSLSNVDCQVLTDSDNTVSREIADELGARVIPSQSVVMAKIGAALLLARYALTARPSCIDNNMQALVPRQGVIIGRFLAYAMEGVSIPSLVKPGPVPSLDVMGMKMSRIAYIPSLEEQCRIADHLDEVTGRIDAMLAKIDELKALLVERRAALITDVVTGRKKIPS